MFLCVMCVYMRTSGFDSWVRRILWRRGMAVHSSILAWRVSWTEKPGGLQSIGFQRVRHDWTTNTHTHTHTHMCMCVHMCIHTYIYIYIIELVLYFPYTCLCRKYNPNTILIHITLIFQIGKMIITSQL